MKAIEQSFGNSVLGTDRSALLDEQVTAIMNAIAIADSPDKLKEFVRLQLASIEAAAVTRTGSGSEDALYEGIRQLLLSGTVDHLAAEDGPEPTEAMGKLRRIEGLIQHARKLDDLSYSGASVAAVLARRPWLESFELEVRSSPEMGDEGGFYTSYTVALSDFVVSTGSGVAIPDELQDDDGTLDESAAAEDIESDLEHYEATLGAAAGLADGEEDERTFTVSRSALQDILDRAAHTPISGIAVAGRLWPEMMKLADAIGTGGVTPN